MSDSRKLILDNIRNGLKGALLPEAQSKAPDIRFPGIAGGLDMFVAELEKLSGKAIRVDSQQEAFEEVVKIFAAYNWNKTLIWDSLLKKNPAFRQILKNAEIETLVTGDFKSLAEIPVGITGASAAIADSGTLVLQNIADQPSYVSLLPEVHIALLCAEDIYSNLQEYLDSIDDLNKTVSASNNLLFVSGPSRTADIELSLTLGVHGPKEVIVIVFNKE